MIIHRALVLLLTPQKTALTSTVKLWWDSGAKKWSRCEHGPPDFLPRGTILRNLSDQFITTYEELVALDMEMTAIETQEDIAIP